MLKLYYNFDYKNILTLDERIDRKEIFTVMNNLTTEEQQRLWKLDTPPIRKKLLWGLDSQKNPCLLILYGKQEVERELRSSPRSYYVDAYLLKSDVTYTHYAVFHEQTDIYHLSLIHITGKNKICSVLPEAIKQQTYLGIMTEGQAGSKI